jgi:hypothetical protein
MQTVTSSSRNRHWVILVAACSLPVAMADEAPTPEVLPPSAAAKAEVTKPEPPSNTDGRCDQCGGCKGVRKVCVAKPVVREKTKICWSAKEEPQCIPGRSIHCGTRCERDECGCYEVDIWQPTCARVITKVSPVKREVTRIIPGVEWTVEERCGVCRAGGSPEPACDAR